MRHKILACTVTNILSIMHIGIVPYLWRRIEWVRIGWTMLPSVLISAAVLACDHRLARQHHNDKMRSTRIESAMPQCVE